MKEGKKGEKKTCTYIGGQAVMEGVMMRGKTAVATAVRDDRGVIQVEAQKIESGKKGGFSRLPFVRGVVNLVSSMVVGTKALMRSAEVYAGEEEEEPSKMEKWLAEKAKIDPMSVVTTVSLLLGLVLAVGLFVFLPYLFTDLIASAAGLDKQGLAYNFIEGGMRIVIFILYLALTGLMKDVRRTYMYHGAEHKTITCFERGMPLTVENVKGCSRIHDRCGTTFMFLVMVIAILVFSVANSFLPFTNAIQNGALRFLVRFLIKLVLLPVVAGISYEILRLLAKIQAKWVTVLKAPGLSLQFLTTKEPTDDMIECAIAAFERVLAMDEGRIDYESSFAVGGKLSDVSARIDELFERAGVEGDDGKWILSLSLGIPVSALKEARTVSAAEARRIYATVNERLTGKPLWYIVGDVDFCGYTLKSDPRALIPRPETELLVEAAQSLAKDGDRVLDLCTGSGAIAIALKKTSEKAGKNLTVEGADISKDALALAKENADLVGAAVSFFRSDLLDGAEGKYDLIVCNPPYIPSGEIESLQREVKDFEPRLALDGGADGLDFYRRIAATYRGKINGGGSLLFETGAGQAEKVAALFEGKGVSTQIKKDLAGIDRIVTVRTEKE